ncbi:F-box domain-containing protein [Pestalotiopsis sp. NC0098]|nr:F-box domain-containing protein [Pestalotiopsis sp. NC0098]
MPMKRRRSAAELPDPATPRPATTKRPRLGAHSASHDDLLSPLSDELLVRILTNLSLPHLLSVAPVSRRFHRLAEDSQVWKRLYYARFVLPRALRIPGFRDGSAREGKLHYSSRRAVWADGRRGGWVDMRSEFPGNKESRDWKRQYKLRHNWSKGKCAVEELRVGEDIDTEADAEASESPPPPKMLVKISEGFAITADTMSGLRAWDLKTKQLVAHMDLADKESDAPPTCLALDDQNISQHKVDIVVGFQDGGFGVWKLDVRDHKLLRCYRHEKSTNGALAGAAFSYPYLLTATESVLISLYTFDRPSSDIHRSSTENQTEKGSDSDTARESDPTTEDEQATQHSAEAKSPAPSHRLDPPYLLTSLKSHTSRAPLALSIRKTTSSTIASIAYTFSTLQGWSLGIQDLHLKQSISNSKTNTPDVTMTRLAYTIPLKTGSSASSPQDSPRTSAAESSRRRDPDPTAGEDGPVSICYTHPYLLATLPDNTLILYLCKSSASSLSISPGIRLWGHTSGISDAEITARGKAVSVSCRGEEIRVWELEGRPDGRSIEVRPTVHDARDSPTDGMRSAFDERRNWVGFDDEMVIVLKESRGTESLMVYDFT